MKNLIQKYLNCIPLRSEELYNTFLNYKLSSEEMKRNGFPMPNAKDPGKVTLMANNMFSKSLNPAVQVCRCGKELSLLEEDWYLDDKGCKFHLGKQMFHGGPENGLYSCCKKNSPAKGCAFNKHHVSFHRPFKDIKFVQAENKSNIILRKRPANIFALDCEMAFTTKGMELTKVSLVGINGEIVFDSYVLPDHPVLDLNTAFSGVREEDLKGVTTNLQEVQSRLLQLFNKDTILIGHSVENDLLALNMIHDKVIDTSCVFPHERGFPIKHSLKYLAAIYLHKSIQDGYSGHNSIEDARTCMELLLWKIYMETVGKFSLVPSNMLLTKPPFLVPPQSNSFATPKVPYPLPPFKGMSVFAPTFLCLHFSLCPVRPFFAVFRSPCVFPNTDNQWWPPPGSL